VSTTATSQAPGSPPFFIWHTAQDPYVWHTVQDPYVPPEHSYRLARALAASGVPHTVPAFAYGPHSLGLARGSGDAANWTALADAWIHEQAPPPG